METVMNYICAFGILALLAIADGAGECAKSNPDTEAMKLIDCAPAARDEHAQVLKTCCIQVERIGKDPRCLCAAMLSNTAKSSGSKPEIAITIPKRCNLMSRPIGYKCGHGQSSLSNRSVDVPPSGFRRNRSDVSEHRKESNSLGNVNALG
ncbi:hypothetical protein LIER_13102 [Lithospermum erythrorhizon]|uniref:Bifunctional inhibitor/plant lipid transfer protein/seed storage helical domain-containing protein n=1 Tax=Lithospermum erythrorhizon TaxID=34254 RepID=A0AAV3PWC7_LITER